MSSTDPLISVLIPCYNRADTIHRCIASALGSGYDRLEVIVSDNGSTDGTADLVAGMAVTEPRIRLIRHPSNRGPLPNWRACLEAASGTLVHWLWSDDWIQPGFYRTLLGLMQAEGAQAAFSAARIVDAAHGWSYIEHSFPPLGRDEALRRGLSGIHFPVSPACALLPLDSVRRHFTDTIPNVAGLECNRRAIGCDALMILGAIHDAKAVSFHPEPLVNFNAHPGSISVTSGADLLLAHYAWARLWWSRQVGLPRSMSGPDVRLLIRRRRFAAVTRWITLPAGGRS